MGTSCVALSIKNIKTRASREMTSRKNGGERCQALECGRARYLPSLIALFQACNQFQGWLTTLTGGSNKERHASCYAAQVRTVINVSQLTESVELEEAVPSIEDRWMNPAMKLGRLKAKTIINYFFSLDKFLFFLESRNMGGFPRLRAAIKNWRKAMKRSVAIDNNKLHIKQRVK